MPSAGGASAPRKRETTSSRCARNGRCSKRCCGQRCRRRREGGRAGGRSGTYLPTKGAERQCSTSSPQWMWEGWCHCGKRWRREPDVRMGAPRAPGAGRGTGGGGGEAGCCRRLGRRRGTTAVLTHTLLHDIGRRGVWRRGALSVVSFPLSGSLDASTLSWDRPRRRAKGSLQRAATVRTADRETGQNVRRHDLYRSNASTIKQKKTRQMYDTTIMLWRLWALVADY